MKSLYLATMAAFAIVFGSGALAEPAFAPAYTDGMVLQRDQPIVIEGSARPGAVVSGAVGGVRSRTAATGDGRFRLTFPARQVSLQPLVVEIDDGTGSNRIEDVLVGDVYLCSGQSNMQHMVSEALDIHRTVKQSSDAHLRLLTIPKTTSALPRSDLESPIRWERAGPKTVESFSAACYFMGERLRADDEATPVGLIHASWGGSSALAWLSPASVERVFGSRVMDQLRLSASDPQAAVEAFAPEWYGWLRRLENGREPWGDSGNLAWTPVPDMTIWNEWRGTRLAQDPRAHVWLRKTFVLTEEQASQDATLELGAIDDLDFTWVNGEPVGTTFGWSFARTYNVPARFLRTGKNEILVHATNFGNAGGFSSPPRSLSFVSDRSIPSIAIGNGWEYSIAQRFENPPRAPWDSNKGMGVMHNAMIHPLGPMRLKAVAWYQGESDTGRDNYAELLAELFDGWRAQFGEQARMLVVQLANFGPRSDRTGPSRWAQLRQAQLDAVLADDEAALVTAIDLGEPNDIHPANKNDLGIRLALAAQGEPMPMPRSATMENGNVVVRFDGIDGALSSYSGHTVLGVELCPVEEDDSCRFTSAVVSGEKLVIERGQIGQPFKVRYAWTNSPIVNLFDNRGIAVPGFEIEIQQN